MSTARLHGTADRPETLPHLALQQAASWFARLRSGDASEAERADWQAWLVERREHGEAWRQVEAISRRFEPLQGGGDRRSAVAAASALQAVRAQRGSRRHVMSGLAALAGTGLLGWAAWRPGGLPSTLAAWTADHHTATGEIRDLALADGSRVVLNTASALDVDFQPGLRRLHLLAGEALVDALGDPRRTLVVDTAAGRLRAFGSRFSVREFAERSCVAVYDGAVEILTARSGHSRVIEAGQQASFDGDAISAPAPADPARQAWTRGVLLAQDIPLKDLIAELARYRHGHLGVAPEVADLRVLGGYPLRDPDKALAMLAAALPVRIQRTLPWWVTVEARAQAR